jgi:hypothetical protein
VQTSASAIAQASPSPTAAAATLAPTSAPTSIPTSTPAPTPTQAPTPTRTPTPAPAPITRGIANIETFLTTCPDRDPLVSTLTQDFQVRRDGVVVATTGCSGDYSRVEPATLPDEVIWLQVFRTAYYMDRGQTVAYPWTGGLLYSWWHSQIAGVNIDSRLAPNSGGYCCTTIAGGRYVVSGPFPADHRDYYQTWKAMSGLIGFVSHEVRHLTGPGHVDCVGPAFENGFLAGGCDARYDESSISSYAVQYWLERAWLSGAINVGIGCLSEASRQDLAAWHLSSLNSLRVRFMSAQPAVVPAPAMPGGPCNP